MGVIVEQQLVGQRFPIPDFDSVIEKKEKNGGNLVKY